MANGSEKNGSFAVGRENKGDIRLQVEKIKGDKIQVEVKSSLDRLYGKDIKDQIVKELKAFDIEGVKITAKDNGALPYVISARVDSVAKRFDKIKETVPPVRDYEKVTRLRRSRLYMPGNNPYLVQNAWLFGADILILDLEDSVPPAEKKDTRILVKHLLLNMDFGSSESSVRINPLWTPYGEDDLREIVPGCPDIIFIPKAECREDILKVHNIVEDIKKNKNIEHEINYFPIIESAKGIVHAYDIASAVDEVVGIAFGAEDYTKDIGVPRTKEGKETKYARDAIVNAAKAAGVNASDTVFSDLDDKETLRKTTLEGKAMGFDGRGAIHPAQIDVIHECHRPADKEIEYAMKVIEAAEMAEKTGAGVVSLGRKMIDPPVVERAKLVIRTAKKLGLIE